MGMDIQDGTIALTVPKVADFGSCCTMCANTTKCDAWVWQPVRCTT